VQVVVGIGPEWGDLPSSRAIHPLWLEEVCVLPATLEVDVMVDFFFLFDILLSYVGYMSNETYHGSSYSRAWRTAKADPERLADFHGGMSRSRISLRNTVEPFTNRTALRLFVRFGIDHKGLVNYICGPWNFRY
jgi:hypothetical protein